MEDVTEMMDVAEMLARHTSQFKLEMTERTEKLETYIKRLEEEINELKKKL
jgi:predicted RNase H-like nuclease (RuvC/YqgF family)